MNHEDTESGLEMLDEYDFSGGIRGKYVDRFPQGCKVVVLTSSVAPVFPDSESPI